MPTLQEVIADPNYVNANFATKQAIFNKYASQDPNYSQANDATRFAIRQKYGVETPVAQEAPTAKPIPQRTYGEAAKDVGGKFVSGIGSLVQLPGQLYGLATGDFSKTGLLGAGEDIKKYGEEMLSPALKAKEEARAQKVQEAEKTGQIAAGATAFGETIKDPALLVGFLVEQIPQIIPALLTGGGTAALTAAGITAREAAALVASGAAKEAAQIAAKKIAAKKAGELGVKAAVGTGAVQQGADIGAGAYEDIYKEAIAKGMSEPEAAQKALGLARAAGASGALISLLAQRLPGARTLEETFAGVPGKTGRILGAGKGALGESVSEMVEEGGGKFTQNLAMREVNPEQDLLAGVGQAAGMAAIGGGGMGAIAGAARRPGAKVETLPPVTGTGNPPTDSPVVGTTTVNVGGKDSVKVNRADGSSDIDGVQVTPPTETAPGEPAAVETLPPADQGVPPPAEIPAAPTNVETLPPAEAPPAATPPAPESVAPVEPEAPEFVPIETEQTKPRGVAKVEFTPEEKQEIKEVEASLVQINKEIREAQAEKGSLFSMLKGKLVERPGAFSLSDIDKNKKSLKQLYSASGQGVLLEDMVADGELDAFLPGENRAVINGEQNENFDAQAAIERIAEKLRNGDYRTEYAAAKLETAQNQKAEIQAQLEKLKSVPSTNLELSEIAEQPKGEATEVSLKDLEEEARSAGVDVDRLREETSDSLPSATIEEFKGAYRNALFAATSGSQSYTIGENQYTIDEIATYISEGFTQDEINELIAQAEAEQADAVKNSSVIKPQRKTDGITKIPPKEKPTVDAGLPPAPPEPKDFKTKKSMEEIAAEIKGMTATQLAQWAVDNAPNSAAKAVSEKVLVRIKELDDRNFFNEPVAVYNRNNLSYRGKFSYAIDLSFGNFKFAGLINGKAHSNTGTRYITILHELLHAATVPLLNAQGKEYNDLTVVLDKVKKQIAADKRAGKKHPIFDVIAQGANTVKNVKELISWGLTYPEFQDYLKTVKVGNTNALTRLVEIFRKFLGLDAQYETALDAVVRAADTLLETPTEVTEKVVGRSFGTKKVAPPAANAPPKLTAPKGFKLKEGRNEQVVLAARELKAGNITKQQFDEYVNYYTPIREILGDKLETPINDDLMRLILVNKIPQKKDPKLVNASIADGTKVGLRMDIPALEWGKANGVNGSVVSIHEGKPATNAAAGKNISYKSAGFLKNAVFAIRSEEKAFGIAQMQKGRAGQKAPQQTIEGTWVNMTPDEIFKMVKEKLNDPAWSQVSLDPLRHSFFYDRSNTKPVVSADEVLQVGRFVLAKNVKYGKRENYLYQQEGQFAGWNSTPEEMSNAQELNGKTMMQVADWSVKKAPNPAVKVIAEKVRARIKEMQARGIPLEFEIVSGQRRPVQLSGARGITEYRVVKKGYEGTKYSIYLNGNTVVENQAAYPPGTRYATVLHELIHVATVGQINYLGSNDPLVAEINNLYKIVADQVKKEKDNPNAPAFVRKFWKGEINAFRDASEMVAWGLTDRDMQEYLSTIKVGETSVFTKLVELFRKVLGLGKPFESALDRLIKTSDAILEEDAHTLGKKFDDANIAFGKETKPAGPPGEQMTLLQQEKPQVTESLDMRKAVTGAKQKVSAALQKRKPLSPTSFEGVPQDFIDKANPIFAPQKKTIVERIEEMKDRFWQRLSQGIADQFRTIKEYSEDAYILARMSKTVDGALEGLMFFGQVFNDGGALNIKQGTKGMIEVLKPLGNEVDRYQMWVALNREADLPANKRSNIDNLDELVGRRNELIAGEIDGKPREQVYKAVRIEMNKLNRSVLKVALDSGLIDSTANAIDRLRERINVAQNNANLSDAKRDKEIEELEAQIDELQKNPIGYERFIADINYIPFYREMEDGDVSKVMTATGLSNQHFSKALEGGVSPFADLMENTLRNWSHILSASMKNQAAAATLNAAEKLGGAEPNLKVPYYIIDGKVYYRSNDEMVGDGSVRSWMTESGKGTVKAMVDGQPVYYQVLDPLLLDSITSIGYMGPKSKFLDVARGFKNVLQFGVTISPAFKVRNLFRDSISAMAVSDLKKNPFANVVNGWALSNKDNPAHMSALAGGALFNFGSIVEGDQAALVKRLIKMGVKEEHILDTPAKIKNQLKKAWDKYQELGNKSESANRMALYQQMKDKGYGHLEASYYARDLLDFSMQGSWPAFRLLTQVVPFLNARTQGLYKLGRDGINPTVRVFYNSITGKPIEQTDKQKAESFGIVTGAVCLASLALYFAFKDDEEFKKRDEWDRDNFWWFKLPGMEYALRIPKPFEIGAFGTLVERTAEQIFDQGSEGKQFEQSLKRMVTDTFAVNLPQFFKPLVDLYANKDSFTGAPIESAGMERLSKQERATDTTSPLAIALGGLTKVMVPGEGLSPVQVDYAIKAYFGWLGGTIAETSHYAVMPFKDGAYPDTKWVDKVSVGFIKSLPSNQSKYATAFYENNKEISQAYADMRHYAEIGDSAKVLKILEEKQDKIGLAKFYDKTAKNMAKVRLQIRMITNDTSMDGATKREEIDRLKSLISMMAEQAEDTRKAMK